jgi:hypothetical protein
LTDEQRVQRQVALSLSGGVCAVCGKPLFESAQGAHRIANTKSNRDKYGSLVIDDPKNIKIVCCLKCNDACNIGNDPVACLKLAVEIYNERLRRL